VQGHRLSMAELLGHGPGQIDAGLLKRALDQP
jgi:hypothetical protein